MSSITGQSPSAGLAGRGRPMPTSTHLLASGSGASSAEVRPHALPLKVDVAVIGGGQAGLSMSWHLQQAGRDHVVLERRDRLGGGWLDRWDAFRLVTPNWT